MAEKSEGELLKEKLFYVRKNTTEVMNDSDIDKAFDFCEGYKEFLNLSKTEREAVDTAVDLLSQNGYSELVPGTRYLPGDKVYFNNRGKAIVFATIGQKPIEYGVKIAASHIDSPRLDLKPNPLYEDSDMALFKTHYYGGIKKYQWTTIALAMHGVVAKKDGSIIKVSIGESADDPVFCITDLLPHLAQEQSKRTLADGIRGEELNILIGSRAFKDDKVSEKVKLNILNLLFEKYGFTEEDFLSADLTFVPAEKARDLGFDRSMIGSYGHDDRVCAYTSMMAAIDADSPEFTTVTVLSDREEIGSYGNTGLDSDYLKNFIADLCEPYNIDVRKVLSNSKCLSADVNCALDPSFSDVSERRNASLLGYGVVVTKYTGARGKSGTSEASAEFMSEIRDILDNAGVIWQLGELGKVDIGGGGTVALYIASMDIDVVDVGVPVLSMHAPFEVVSKTDVYMTYRAFYEFLK